MSLKKQLANEINALEREIQYLEIKRSRSIAALLESYISQTRPNDDDVAFFRAFTQEIESKRQQLQELTNDYDNL
jgi:metal-responsive CopG/Arc/MetJ family transcriptional regulator